MTSDATPDTPVNPRAWQKDAEKIAIDIATKVAERLRSEGEDNPRAIALGAAGAVFGALRRAGYLRALDEGSLRSQASGTPMDTGEEP